MVDGRGAGERRRPARVIAHRGASGHLPEHTEAAYRLAIELGADAVEPDVVVSRDGVLVLRHENELSGSTDVASRPEFAARRTVRSVDGVERSGWFTEDFDWAELATLRAREPKPELRPASAAHDGEWPLLRLDELLALLAAAERPVGLVAELKHASHFAARGLRLDELAAPLLAAVDPGLLTVESFEEGVLHGIRDRSLGGRTVYLLEDHGRAPDLPAGAPGYLEQLTGPGLAALAGRVDGISVPCGLLFAEPADPAAPSGLVARAHGLGLDVLTWTLRAENRFLPARFRRGADAAHGDWRGWFGAVLGTGVDGVFADQPELALAARDDG